MSKEGFTPVHKEQAGTYMPNKLTSSPSEVNRKRVTHKHKNRLKVLTLTHEAGCKEESPECI